MFLQKKYTPFGQAGFSLVELMIALVIGSLATLVITQVLSIYEGQKRSTMGSSDTQTNGSIGLFAMQRETLMAGYGLPLFDTKFPPLLCSNFSPATMDISPVTIAGGGNGQGSSDTITVRYGDSPFGAVPQDMIAGTVVASSQAQVELVTACQVNDDALVTNGTACTLTKVTAVATPLVTLAANDNMAVSARLACMGKWRQVQFRVVSNQLERVESSSGAADVVTPISSDIVALKAQYGVSTVQSNNKIDQWVDGIGAWAPETVRTTPSLRNRIKAIRVAIVARNGQLEKEDVTSACSSNTAASPTGLCAWDATSAAPATASPAPVLDLSNTANWKRYRYRAFDVIIPLRNMVWSKETLS